jgi:hypothetical protein
MLHPVGTTSCCLQVKEDLSLLVGLLQQEQHSLTAGLLQVVKSLLPWWQRAAQQQQQQQRQSWPWEWEQTLKQQQKQKQQQWQQQQQKRLRIVVFIDDLDRCRPSKVVEVLEAINVVLGPSGFTVVAGMVRHLNAPLPCPREPAT